MDHSISDILSKGAFALDIALPPDATAQFELYYSFLERSRQDFNLTAISGAEDVARLHFLDSLALLNIIQSGLQTGLQTPALLVENVSANSPAGHSGTMISSSVQPGKSAPVPMQPAHTAPHSSPAATRRILRVIDIGSGAGFPGIPLKIADPSVDFTLLESNGKRITFLTKLCAALGVSAAFIHARAEESSHSPDVRECFDAAVSRAVASLNVLCELCLPFVRVGGLFLAMKGADSDAEIAEAENAIRSLGARFAGNYDYIIPGTDITHRVVIIEKVSPTPDAYPRRFARISKNPL